MGMYKKIPLWGKILIGLVLGILAGFIFGEKSIIIEPLGTLFINAIKMLIVPLVFSSLIVGVTSIEDIGKMGRIGLKTITVYIITTAVAILIGLGFSWVMKPGAGLMLKAAVSAPRASEMSIIENIVSFIPSNPIKAMADGNILQVILFAILCGIAINLAGEKAKSVKIFFEGFAEVMYKLTGIVMEIAPYGVFALIAVVIGKHGIEFILPLLKVVATVYIGCLLQTIFVLGGGISLLCRLNPFKFFKGFLDAIMLAFSTSSSSAALPASIKCCQDNLGVSKSIASFVLPLGATINMNGTALYQGVCAVFIAQVYGIHLSAAGYFSIVFTAVISAIGTAGVPGAGPYHVVSGIELRWITY